MSVTEEAIKSIRMMIMAGELGPGDKLPKEAVLAERLGLSRNSLREAVRALSMVRVLDVRQGDGTYVTSLAPEELLEAMAFAVDLHQDVDVTQFLEIRRILEPGTAATAAARLTDGTLDELDALCTRMESPDTAIGELVDLDVRFHGEIAAAAANPALAALLSQLSNQTLRARVWRGLTQDGVVERTHMEHREILSALRSRQPDLAAAWTRVHIAGVESWLVRALDEGTYDSPSPAAE